MTSDDEQWRALPSAVWAWLLLFAAYFGAAALGLALAFPGTNASPFWPPTALALALLYRFGSRLWPIILTGAFAINFAFMLRAGMALVPAAAASSCVGVGNMLEAWIGVRLLRRVAGAQFPFAGVRGLSGFFLAAMLAPGISATIGVTSSRMAGLGGSASYLQNWLTWWIGDTSGALTMAPILMEMLRKPWRMPTRPRLLEAVGLLFALVFGTTTALDMWQLQGEPHHLAFFLLPIILWATLRFQSVGAASAVFTISAIAVIGSLAGSGPFVRGDVNESLILLQVFIIVLAGTTLSLGTVLTERSRLMARLAQSNAELNELALHDPLTGLPNRRALADRIEQAERLVRRLGRRAALLLLDLDRFKRINDSLGHAIGDELLCIVAQRLRRALREVDTVCRLGGDEFVILLGDIEAITDAGIVAQKIIESFREPIRLTTLDLGVSASIGISIVPEDGVDADHLIRCADMAMYRAKERGRANFQYYEESMHRAAVARITREHEMLNALKTHQFRLDYQPIVDLHTRVMVGVHTLLRWQHPRRGLLSPPDFIALAEETGLIVDLGARMLLKACADAVGLRSAGLNPLRLSIDISPRQLRARRLPQQIEQAFSPTRLDSLWLGLEITECLHREDLLTGIDFLNPLGRIGIALSLENFGSAGAPLDLIAQLPVEVIKIDGKIVSRLPGDRIARDITRGVIAMAHELRVKVLAECVENQAQSDFLTANGCDYAQGFWFYPPQSPAELQALLSSSVHG